MRSPLLASAGALLAAALCLSACDASPYAAVADGQTISQAALQNELHAWSSNKAWVTSFDNQQSSGQQGSATVAGAGGAGTYSATFASGVLSVMVVTTILSRNLPRPPADVVAASRAYNEATGVSYWSQFQTSVRQLLVDRLSYYAMATPISTDEPTLLQAYQQVQPYLFTSLCYQEAVGLDQASAQALSITGNLSGPTLCDDQVAFEGEPPAFQAAVRPLSQGQVSQPIKTSFGYQVAKVVRRTTPGLSPGVLRVLSVITAQTAPPRLTALLASARVKVNPAYGTWSKQDGAINPPTVNGQ